MSIVFRKIIQKNVLYNSKRYFTAYFTLYNQVKYFNFMTNFRKIRLRKRPPTIYVSGPKVYKGEMNSGSLYSRKRETILHELFKYILIKLGRHYHTCLSRFIIRHIHRSPQKIPEYHARSEKLVCFSHAL